MPAYTSTPNMNLIEPTPLIQSAPLWASQINSSLTLIDAHDHSPGNGVLITPAGLNINLDLNFNGNSAIDVNTVTFFNNVSSLASSFHGCVYQASGDLYYNNSAGTAVRITNGSSVVGASGTITGMGGTTASVAFSSGTGSFTFQQATSTAGDLDIGSLIVRYPGAYPSPSGNYISIQAPTSLASGYVITLPALPAQTNVVTLSAVGTISSVTWDAVGSNMTSVGANAIAGTMTATGANAIGTTMTSTGSNAVAASRTRTTGASTLGIGGVPSSSSSGSFSTTSATFVNVTNLSVTLTTSGRPIQLMLITNGDSGAQVFASNGNSPQIQLAFLRDGSIISSQALFWNTAANVGASTIGVPCSSFKHLDIVGAGTYTYTVQARSTGGGSTVGVISALLIAYEL